MVRHLVGGHDGHMTNDTGILSAPPAPQPWVRSSRDARLGGVCAGIARRHHVDPVIIRVLVVLLGLSAALGVVLYAAAWAFWPDDQGGRPPIERWFPASTTWSVQRKRTLTIIASLICISTFGSALPFSLGPALVVLVAWRIARRQTGRASVVQPAAVPTIPQAPLSPEFGAAAYAWQQRIDTLEGRATPAPVAPTWTTSSWVTPAMADPLGIYAPTAPVPSQATRRSSRPRFVITLLVLLIAAGAAGLGYLTPNTEPAWRMAVAAALAVIAVALLIGARTGRPRMLIFLGIILSVVAVSPTAPLDLRFSGPVNQAYTTQASLPADYTVGFTDATLDLSGLALTTDATLPVDCAASSLVILLPAGVRTTLTHEQVASTLTLAGEDTTAHSGTWTSGPTDNSPTLTLQLEAAGCEVTVR